MALGNYLFTGSYTKIYTITIDPHVISISIAIYQDATKTKHLASRGFAVDMQSTMWETDSMTELDAPPTEYVPGRLYFLSATPTGQWANMPYPSYTRYNSAYSVWDSWAIQGEVGPVRDLSTGRKYYKKSDGTLRACDDQFDLVDYNNYFSYEVLDEDGLNHTGQAYLLLKTLPEFSSCTDV